MNNLLDPTDTYADQSESKSYGDVPPPATPNRRASVESHPIPLPEKKPEPDVETKLEETKSYGEHPPPPPPPPPPPQKLRAATDFQPISPLPGRTSETASTVQVPQAEMNKTQI